MPMGAFLFHLINPAARVMHLTTDRTMRNIHKVASNHLNAIFTAEKFFHHFMFVASTETAAECKWVHGNSNICIRRYTIFRWTCVRKFTELSTLFKEIKSYHSTFHCRSSSVWWIMLILWVRLHFLSSSFFFSLPLLYFVGFLFQLLRQHSVCIYYFH